MKAQHGFLYLLGAMLFLCSLHARSLKRCPLSMDTNTVKKSFQEIKSTIPVDMCCVTWELLEFYVKRVFPFREELDLHISREVSSISNSFLPLQRTVKPCKEQKLCPCSKEATNVTRTIHSNYNQLEVRAAAIKSLGELDVFLAWIDKNYHQET
ncbi:PREDICTED: interleukin-19 [Elephantulus edwardii]|uniref:interleukin-19 n=1 Tax=Elephantulus edwardii TaxID=28737 RepID=UPI0003F0C528|nr:PREDICTED: interleukin-19 [Elephantulus edwardii]